MLSKTTTLHLVKNKLLEKYLLHFEAPSPDPQFYASFQQAFLWTNVLCQTKTACAFSFRSCVLMMDNKGDADGLKLNLVQGCWRTLGNNQEQDQFVGHQPPIYVLPFLWFSLLPYPWPNSHKCTKRESHKPIYTLAILQQILGQEGIKHHPWCNRCIKQHFRTRQRT